MGIKLGSLVKDSITGFTGIATGDANFMYGCRRIQIESKMLKDGKPIEAQWFDEQRVEIVKVDKPKVSENSRATSGGPQNDPTRSGLRP